MREARQLREGRHRQKSTKLLYEVHGNGSVKVLEMGTASV